MSPIAFYIFGAPIYWYGIIISIGVMAGIYLAMRNAKFFGENPEDIVDFCLLAIPMAIVGARLYYVIFEWSQYKDNLIDIINLRKGGLAIFGGVLAGILAGFIFTKWKKINFWNLADICAPSVILGQAIGRWGNFFNQEAYGYAVKNPALQWFPAAVFIKADNQWHMATFFYEFLWNLLVFFFLMTYRKKRVKKGEVFLLYLILYSAGRIVIEGLRTDSLYYGAFRVSQVLSGLLIILGIALFVIHRKKNNLYSIDHEEENNELGHDSNIEQHEKVDSPEEIQFESDENPDDKKQ